MNTLLSIPTWMNLLPISGSTRLLNLISDTFPFNTEMNDKIGIIVIIKESANEFKDSFYKANPNKKIYYIVAKYDQIPFKKKSFDIILKEISLNESIYNHEIYIANIRDTILYLKKGGTILVKTDNILFNNNNSLHTKTYYYILKSNVIILVRLVKNFRILQSFIKQINNFEKYFDDTFDYIYFSNNLGWQYMLPINRKNIIKYFYSELFANKGILF